MSSDHHPLEDRYAIALKAGQIGIWTWSRGTEAIVWDNAARAIVGLPSGVEVRLADLAQLFHAEDQPSVRAAMEAVIRPRGYGSLAFDGRILRRDDGRERWISIFGQVECDPDGVKRLCGAVRDVDETRRAQADATRVEAKLSAIVSIAADAIISVDEGRHITLFNDGAEQMFGYDRAEMLGKPVDILLPERYRAAHSRHMERFTEDERSSRRMGERAEIYARRKSGEEFPAEASISHISVSGEQVFTVVMRDVSERKRALDLLAANRAELEQRVAERTVELKAEMQRREETQAQLLRTQRMEAFGQLTGGIAHDFNNLLTVIIGNLELLEMQLEDEKALRLLKRAQDSAEMGARLTSRLLTFARRRQFAPTLINLNEQVMGMVDLLKRSLGEHIDLNASLAPRLWTVRADPSEVENAVLNLAINARDAMPNGGRLVISTANVDADEGTIGAIEKLPSGAYVRVSVSDTGTGMAPDVLARAFEPFYTTKQPGKGTGLGLSSIYGFAQQSGGTATIYSEHGIGTTVNLYLPRSDEAAEPEGDGEDYEIPTGSGELVLLVEDNAEVREVARSHLEALGYRVIEAPNGVVALEKLAETTGVDVVFSDVVMPGGLSGFDVANQVRGRWPAIKVLLTSGFANEVLRAEGHNGVELPMLTKPYSRAELARSIRRVLDT